MLATGMLSLIHEYYCSHNMFALINYGDILFENNYSLIYKTKHPSNVVFNNQ